MQLHGACDQPYAHAEVEHKLAHKRCLDHESTDVAIRLENVQILG